MNRVVRPDLIKFRKKYERMKTQLEEFKLTNQDISRTGQGKGLDNSKMNNSTLTSKANSSILKNSNTSHDLFINKTKLNRHQTSVSLKNNKSISTTRLFDNESLNLTKSMRPGSAMTNSQNVNKVTKGLVFNFKSNNSNLTEDQKISRKEKAYKSFLHTKNQLEIENKQNKELENKLNQVIFKRSDLKVQLLYIIKNCKNDHGDLSSTNIR